MIDTAEPQTDALGPTHNPKKGMTQADPKLPIGTRKCKCVTCGEYFSAISAFDMHLKGGRHVHPSQITDRDGQPLLEDKGGYWGGVGSWEHK